MVRESDGLLSILLSDLPGQAVSSAEARMFEAALVLLTLTAVGVATLKIRRGFRRFWRERRFSRARRLETDAGPFLLSKGFEVTGRRVRRTVWVVIDGVEVRYDVEADYLVTDLAGLLYVAEVKTGSQAPNPAYTATRRQLLEYDLAFAEAQGLLLVDMEGPAIKEVRFPSQAELLRRGQQIRGQA
jgi:hypothetical protein